MSDNIYGHTVLQRALGLGYQSEWAQAHLPSRRECNEFYTRVGYRVRKAWLGSNSLVRPRRRLTSCQSRVDDQLKEVHR